MKGIANRQNTLLGRKLMVRAPKPGKQSLPFDRKNTEPLFPKKPRKGPPQEPGSKS